MPIDSHLPQADPFSLVPTFNKQFWYFLCDCIAPKFCKKIDRYNQKFSFFLICISKIQYSNSNDMVYSTYNIEPRLHFSNSLTCRSRIHTPNGSQLWKWWKVKQNTSHPQWYPYNDSDKRKRRIRLDFSTGRPKTSAKNWQHCRPAVVYLGVNKPAETKVISTTSSFRP